MADGFDFGIYQQPQGQEQNPLGMLGGIVHAAQGINELKQWQQEYAARKAMPELAKDAIGPDGQMDWNKFGLLLSTHPETAYKAPEIVEKIKNMGLIDAQKFGVDLDNAHKQMTSIGDAATGLLSLGNKVTKQDVVGALGNLYSMGMIQKDKAINWATQIPDNPADIQKMLRQIALQSTQQKDSLGQVLGSFQTVQTGDTMHGLMVKPGVEGGQIQPLFDQPMGLTPGERLHTTEVKGPYGTDTGYTTDVLGDPTKSQPGAGLQGPGVAGAQGGIVPVQSGPLGGPAPAPPRAPVQTDMGPFTAQQADAFAKSKTMVDNQAKAYDTMLYNISKAEEQMRHFDPGGGASVRAMLAKAAQTAGLPEEMVNKIGNSSLPATQVFDKITTTQAFDMLRSLLQGQGRINESEFNTVLSVLPKIDTDPKAIHTLFNMVKNSAMFNRMEQDARTTWAKQRMDPAGFDSWWQDYFQRYLDKRGIKLYTPKG